MILTFNADSVPSEIVALTQTVNRHGAFGFNRFTLRLDQLSWDRDRNDRGEIQIEFDPYRRYDIEELADWRNFEQWWWEHRNARVQTNIS